MGIRVIHDKEASATAAKKCFAWVPRDARLSRLTAGVEFDREDLEHIVSALFRERERLTLMLRQTPLSDAETREFLKTVRADVRRLEHRVTAARDAVKAEQVWRDFESKHPARGLSRNGS